MRCRLLALTLLAVPAAAQEAPVNTDGERAQLSRDLRDDIGGL